MSLEVATQRQLLRALADPLRVRILSLLTGEEMSAAQLARALNVSQALASYHLKRLVEVGLVELVGTRPNRGAVERLYRAREPAQSLSVSESEDGPLQLMAAVLAEIQRRLPERDPDSRTFVADAELWVDPLAMAQAQDAVERALTALIATALPAGTTGAVRVSASGVLFHLLGDAEPRDSND